MVLPARSPCFDDDFVSISSRTEHIERLANALTCSRNSSFVQSAGLGAYLGCLALWKLYYMEDEKYGLLVWTDLAGGFRPP